MYWEKPGKILTGNHGCSHKIWELAVVVVFLKPIHRNVEKNMVLLKIFKDSMATSFPANQDSYVITVAEQFKDQDERKHQVGCSCLIRVAPKSSSIFKLTWVVLYHLMSFWTGTLIKMLVGGPPFRNTEPSLRHPNFTSIPFKVCAEGREATRPSSTSFWPGIWRWNSCRKHEICGFA